MHGIHRSQNKAIPQLTCLIIKNTVIVTDKITFLFSVIFYCHSKNCMKDLDSYLTDWGISQKNENFYLEDLTDATD